MQVKGSGGLTAFVIVMVTAQLQRVKPWRPLNRDLKNLS